jgi:hypothetical protein
MTNQLGARVAGAVACGWFDAWVAGDERALDALATAREWPVLLAMQAEGDYPEVLWELVAAARSGGDVPAGKPGIDAAQVYEEGLGC